MKLLKTTSKALLALTITATVANANILTINDQEAKVTMLKVQVAGTKVHNYAVSCETKKRTVVPDYKSKKREFEELQKKVVSLNYDVGDYQNDLSKFEKMTFKHNDRMIFCVKN